jgi:hypothetical protein
MNSSGESQKTTWSTDRAAINACFRRHPIIHFFVLYSIAFTAVSLVGFLWNSFGGGHLRTGEDAFWCAFVALPAVLVNGRGRT